MLDNPNILQKKTLCVYINHVLDVKAFVVRSLSDGQSKPTSLFFALINVGKAGFKWQCIHCKQITGQCAMLIGKKENNLW